MNLSLNGVTLPTGEPVTAFAPPASKSWWTKYTRWRKEDVMPSRPKNHKELVAELRSFHKFLKKLNEGAAIFRNFASTCPDTQFYFPDVAKGFTQMNINMKNIEEFLESAADLVKEVETSENLNGEMTRGGNHDIKWPASPRHLSRGGTAEVRKQGHEGGVLRYLLWHVCLHRGLPLERRQVQTLSGSEACVRDTGIVVVDQSIPTCENVPSADVKSYLPSTTFTPGILPTMSVLTNTSVGSATPSLRSLFSTTRLSSTHWFISYSFPIETA